MESSTASRARVPDEEERRRDGLERTRGKGEREEDGRKKDRKMAGPRV